MAHKFKIVVSDLHLSAGRIQEGNLLEDFDQDLEFAGLLAEIAAESERDVADVELILNGDAFEMLQVPHEEQFDPARAYRPDQYHSSSEEDSVRKMALIIEGHQPFFAALGGFIQAEPSRRSVTFVKGNHDLNLHWRGVQDRIRQAVGAMGRRRSLLAFEERRISREGIYVEHGNQYAEVVDRVPDMDEPHDHDKPGQLALPLGSWFVMDVFNKVEREKYWIDGIKPITALVWYALAFDFPFAARAIATLVRALPGVIRQGLLEAQEPRAEALAQQLENPDRVEELANRYETDLAFRTEFNQELVGMLAPPPTLAESVAPALSSVSDPVALGEQVQRRVRSSLFEMAALRAGEEGAQLVTFGHTHDAGLEPLPDGGAYINSGTWTWRADFGQEGKKTWRDLFEHPERFTRDRVLSYVRIDYDDQGEPSGQLLAYVPAETPARPEPTLSGWWHQVVDWLRNLWDGLLGEAGP